MSTFAILTSRPDDSIDFKLRTVRFQPEGIRHQQSDNTPCHHDFDQSDLLPLPDTMLDWTATAIVLWDDLPPSAITPGNRALADWIHFGGLLIVNGAVASENLSFQLSLIFCRCNWIRLSNWISPGTNAFEIGVLIGFSLDQQLAILSQQAGGISFSGTLHRDANISPAVNFGCSVIGVGMFFNHGLI